MELVASKWIVVAVLYILPFSLAQIALPKAYCSFVPTEIGRPYNITGGVTFQVQDFKTVSVTARIFAGLPDGPYSMSIYEFGDITDKVSGLRTGNIFSRADAVHGCPPNPKRREGDMGNWTLTHGKIDQTQSFTLISLTNPTTSVIGLSVVLRASYDNCSGVDGYSGPRLAQCVIGIANQLDNQADYADQVTSAICSLQPTSNTYCMGRPCDGTIWFNRDFQSNLWVITAQVHGLPLGAYGFHIHEFGDLSKADGSTAGAHYNPFGHSHNLPPIVPRHVGDLGSIQSFYRDGTGWYRYIDQNLGEDISSLIGRAVVIHSGIDHGSGLGCDQSGSSGQRIMWGIIGISNTGWALPPSIPDDLVIDNTWKSVPCGGGDGGSGGSTTTNGGTTDGGENTDPKVVAIAVGWMLAVFFFFTTVGMAACWYQARNKGKGGGGYTELDSSPHHHHHHTHTTAHPRTPLRESDDEDYRTKYRRQYGRY